MNNTRKKLIKDLLYADSICSSELSEEYLQDIIYNLTDISQLYDLDTKRDEFLWQWLPAIAFGIFGLKEYKRYQPLRVLDKTFIMIPPLHKGIANNLTTALLNEGYDIETHQFKFDKKLTARIYGAFPWYRSYLRAAIKFNCIGQTGITITINTSQVKTINELLVFKNSRRESFAKSRVLKCLDLEFDGVINPFHSPNHIENERHLIAVGLIDKEVTF